MFKEQRSSSSRDESLRTEFNDWAEAGRGESMEKGHRPVGEQAIAAMNIPSDARILDIGCGSGWATRLMAEKAEHGWVMGIDIADKMIEVARESSKDFRNAEYRVATAEHLPFADNEFSHAFSMESLYYYENIPAALREIARVLRSGGMFLTVVDLYQENRPSHQWTKELKVPVQLLSIADYRSLFEDAGFVNVQDQRLYDPTPVPEDYAGGSFKSRDDFVEYRKTGSLMIKGEIE